jgi:hypothetical protein
MEIVEVDGLLPSTVFLGARTMTKDSEAQEERAKKLREDIEKTVEEASAAKTPAKDSPPGKSERPRDFIHRRMRELDQDKQP